MKDDGVEAGTLTALAASSSCRSRKFASLDHDTGSSTALPSSLVLLTPCSTRRPSRLQCPCCIARPQKRRPEPWDTRDTESVYAFALVVFFLCALPVFCATACSACSCAFRYVGAFSHGRLLCTICFRIAVTERADNGWLCGIPYFARYDRPSNPCSLRCRTESCLKLAPHSRHVTVCLVMLFLQLTGFDGVSGGATVTLP